MLGREGTKGWGGDSEWWTEVPELLGEMWEPVSPLFGIKARAASAEVSQTSDFFF